MMRHRLGALRKRWNISYNSLLIGVLMLIFGFNLINLMQQIRRQSTQKPIAAAYRQALEEKKKQEERFAALSEEQRKLQSERVQVMRDALTISDNEELLDRLDMARALAGFTEVKGPGVIITLEDKQDFAPGKDSIDSIIHDKDIMEAINYLVLSGAGALSLNDLRITPTTSAICGGATIQCNQKLLAPPFVLRAVGDPKAMAEAVRTSKWFAYKTSREVNARIRVEESDQVLIVPFAEQDALEPYINLIRGGIR